MCECRSRVGVAQDYGEAVRWYRMAADKGNATAMLNLCLLYELGAGVPGDVAKARRWLTKAADLGDPRARDLLAKFR